MEAKLPRTYFIELVGTFGLVLFSAGLVCINQTTTPAGQTDQTFAAPLTLHQPGMFGVALGQGLIFAAMLALTAPVTGGYLNPAVTLMLWVFNRVDTGRAAWLMSSQIIGGTLAAIVLRFTFHAQLLQAAQYGAPHLNLLAFPTPGPSGQVAGVVIEMLLTFFLVFAIFGMAGTDALRLGLVSGMIMTVCALFGLPLTGAALNPARWFGPTFVEAISGAQQGHRLWADALVYLAGPIIGALLGGFFVFKIYRPAEVGKDSPIPTTVSHGRKSSDEATAIKAGKSRT